MKNLLLLLLTVSFFSGRAQSYLLPSRPSVVPQLAPFYHGVASGDPLSDRVIIWTRVTTNDAVASVDWQMATDTSFSNVVNSGNVNTDSSVDYTVKVDVLNLQPNTWYYYRFKADNAYSITGRTRTAPVGNIDSLRFGIIACSNFQAGYFNVYKDLATRNDLDAILHLGDYYYEYKAGGYGYTNDSSRLHPYDHDAFTLADYRLWHSQYKLDPDLRNCHQQYPFITIWDDHETANNSWYGGAENHNSSTEGDWFTRKDAGKKAYFEWMPIREEDLNEDTIIHRTEHWGDLLDLIMIDTRYEGRDSSLGSFIPANDPIVTDTNRTILGAGQRDWLKGQLSNSTAKWKIIGNQVMVAPLLANLGNGNQVLNGDQWDGYPADRKRVFDHIMQNNIHNVVFLTGDIHCSWGNDLPHPDSVYNKNTGAGSVATEFVCTSVTSPTLAGIGTIPLNVVQGFDPHVKYGEFTLRGYLLLDINKQRVQGDWIHMSTVATKNYTATDDAHWMNVDQERFLRQAPAALGPRPGNPGLMPFFVDVKDIAKDNMIVITCYPNPAESEVAIQYYLFQPAKVDLFITSMTGQIVRKESIQQTQSGLFNTKAYLDDLAAGTYLVSISAGGKTYSKQLVKLK
ncbi:MAG: Alkaline phosphatase [Bacteroidota bacterium]|nr:Alkaline phosphatase [Bacteroidota bacterium]